MKIQKHNILGLLLLASMAVTAQTTNVGELTIMPNTQMSVVDNYNNTTTASFMNDGELWVYANFNNDGLLSYFDVANNGLTRFQGNVVQQISGSALSELNNVLFNNPSALNAFQLSGTISIANQADFDLGIVQNDGFGGAITFQNMADHINTSNDSHVDGLVYKEGDTGFNFPIGDAGFYRAAAITASNTATNVFASKYIFENSNTLYPHDMAVGVIDFIDNTEYWTITREQGDDQVMVTIGWDASTSPTEISNAPASAIRIVRWDEVQGFWVDQGSVVDEVNQTVTTVAELSDYGVFTLATVKEDIILPDDVVIYNAVSPDGDGDNDFFFIDGIANYPDNTVKIFNRWGVKVFDVDGYNETDNVFKGLSDGRITIKRQEQLPVGTYFYILNYNTGGSTSQTVKKAGYLYINPDDN